MGAKSFLSSRFESCGASGAQVNASHCLTIPVTEGRKMSSISAGTRKELVAAGSRRYQESTATENGSTLDEFAALTGYHRKHAIRVVNGKAPGSLGRTECHGHLSLAPKMRDQLMAMRAATINRRLVERRSITLGQRRRSSQGELRSRVPVRTFAAWQDPSPSFVDGHLVARCGGAMSGSFA